MKKLLLKNRTRKIIKTKSRKLRKTKSRKVIKTKIGKSRRTKTGNFKSSRCKSKKLRKTIDSGETRFIKPYSIHFYKVIFIIRPMNLYRYRNILRDTVRPKNYNKKIIKRINMQGIRFLMNKIKFSNDDDNFGTIKFSAYITIRIDDDEYRNADDEDTIQYVIKNFINDYWKYILNIDSDTDDVFILTDFTRVYNIDAHVYETMEANPDIDEYYRRTMWIHY